MVPPCWNLSMSQLPNLCQSWGGGDWGGTPGRGSVGNFISIPFLLSCCIDCVCAWRKFWGTSMKKGMGVYKHVGRYFQYCINLRGKNLSSFKFKVYWRQMIRKHLYRCMNFQYRIKMKRWKYFSLNQVQSLSLSDIKKTLGCKSEWF